MLTVATAAFALIAEVLRENDNELAKRIIGRVLRILGGADPDEHKQEKLAAFMEYMARERASSATSAMMARAKKNG